MDDDDRWMHSLSGGGWRGYVCGVTTSWSVRLRLMMEVEV